MSVYEDKLANLWNSSNLREIPADSLGSDLIDLSSNDYLGVASNQRLREEFLNQPLPALTASASRLLAADQQEFAKLEALLRDYYSAWPLLFNSGYHANVGAISALAKERCIILADKLVHASMIDGIMLSRAPFERFRHNDVEHLRRLLEKHASKAENVLVLIESVYSMDGDQAPLQEICELKRDFPNMLIYCDEAHALGVCGPCGLGLARQLPEVDFIVGTLGKAIGSMGAYVVCRKQLHREYLVNTARSLIFSTALPPLNVAWSRHVLEHVPQMEEERRRLRKLSQQLAEVLGGKPSHIQPYIVGSSEAALGLSASLREVGFKVLPIRTPTVPPGTERLRFSLSAALTCGFTPIKKVIG